jgi:hypothetical protein
MAIESVLITDWALAKQNGLSNKMVSNCFVIFFDDLILLFHLGVLNFLASK